TAVITAERGERSLTRYGLEEYVADCVVLLDHRVHDQVSTRRLRVVKYRGSGHGTNEYPFLIGDRGISVLPVTSLNLEHEAPREWVSSGLPKLDRMLGGHGFYRGSSALISGTAGSGKTTLAAKFIEAACARGERAMYFAMEESPNQIQRNMLSVGIDLKQHFQKGLLKFHASRPTYNGLEMHLVTMHDMITSFRPNVIVIDPVTNLVEIGTPLEVKSMLTRLIDFLKLKKLTSIFTSLTSGGADLDQSEIGVSSLMDTWMIVRNIESGGERNRGLYVLKSRGMANSSQVREFVLSRNGIDLIDVYLGGGEVLVGSARLAREAREREEAIAQEQQAELRRRHLERRRKTIAAQIESLQAELEAEEAEARIEQRMAEQRDVRIQRQRLAMGRQRNAEIPQKNGKSASP
ncbi:MAG TPA: circadian clock protein KaiC, partial [Patescibacteria group bacterium]|nr:circadian clock protein KaiC [Patescibacteria group bacterium]